MSDTQPDTGTPDTPEQPDTTTTAEQQPDTDTLAAEVAKWKALAQKHEKRAKDNADAAKELDQLRTAAMSDQEKAVATAVAQARSDMLRQVGARLVDAEVRAAAAGKGIDTDALLDGLDRTRFLDDDGEPKRDDIAAWLDRLMPTTEGNGRTPDFGQGARGGRGTPATGLGNDDALTRSLKHVLGIS